MKKRHQQNAASVDKPDIGRIDAPASAARPPITRWKLWLFRMAVLIAAPAVFLALVEVILRLAGFGYPAAFLLPSSNRGQKTFVQNNQFAWRFFGRDLARMPHPFSIAQTKDANTVRIFVFGESAAKGDPVSRFGLPRMLEAILSLRYPGLRFEVVNAAMTGINSHAILPIARDCARAGGDIWVIYMGNNEVVGPFGAGTVFGPQTPPLPLIRGSIALNATRTGQLLDAARQWAQPTSRQSEWGGMKMFLDQQVRADDARMNSAYHHFERNLGDIIKAGRRSGAAIVASTVAVNLKDCAPFASAHRSGLSGANEGRWKQLYEAGAKAQESGNAREAAERFAEAAQIDDSFAELRFRQASCALALGQTQETQRHFRAARDFDTLRFRCDSRFNELVRQTASNHAGDRVLLADAERAFAQQSPDGLPGNEWFYEHVHLTFEGNHLLARTIATEVEKLLPGRITAGTNASRPWPSVADCARRLAWNDWNRLAALNNMLARVKEPPFTGQLNHEKQLQSLTAQIETLAPVTEPAGVAEARRVCETALAEVPDDPWLHGQLVSLKQAAGDLVGAAASARRVLELLPSNPEAWSQLGLILAQQQQFEEAAATFRRAFQLDPRDAWTLQNLAQSLWTLGRREEAIREYQRALRIKPDFGVARINLGQLLEESGRKAEAEDCYRKALANGGRRLPDALALARFCQSRGWLEAAATNYHQALQLAPADAKLWLEAGQNLVSLGRYEEATRCYAEAARLAPESAQAHLYLGLGLARQGKSGQAAESFREALRLKPDMVDARLNLGVALIKQGRAAEALAELNEVLRLSPTNAQALKYAEVLRAGFGDGTTR